MSSVWEQQATLWLCERMGAMHASLVGQYRIDSDSHSPVGVGWGEILQRTHTIDQEKSISSPMEAASMTKTFAQAGTDMLEP